MSDQSTSPSRSSFPVLPALAVTVIVSAVIFHNIPLDSARPQHEPLPEVDKATHNRVRARLWQDPLKAVYDQHRKEENAKQENAQNDIARELKEVRGELGEIKKKLQPTVALAPPIQEQEPTWRFKLSVGNDQSDPASDEVVSQRNSVDAAPLAGIGSATAQIKNRTIGELEKKISQSTISEAALELLHTIERQRPAVYLTSSALQHVRDTRFLTLSVLLPGGPYPEDAEDRLRTRYAVLSALGQADYEPRPLQLDYLDYMIISKDDIPQCQSRNPCAGDQHNNPRDESVFLVPYEWFLRTPESTNAGEGFSPVVVFWLDEDALLDPCNIVYGFDEDFARRIRKLLAQLDKRIRHKLAIPFREGLKRNVLHEMQRLLRNDAWTQDPPEIDSPILAALQRVVEQQMRNMVGVHRVIGPTDSQHLSELRQPTIAAPTDLVSGVPLPEIEVFCPWATVDDRYLQILDRSPVANFVTRTTSSDLALFGSLITELKLRGVDLQQPAKEDNAWPFVAKDHIALIGEWDTLYGRARRRTIIDAIFDGATDPENTKIAKRHEVVAPNLHFIDYMRGLDGHIPDEDSLDTNRTSKDAAKARPASNDLPAGRAQLDYLRRLARQLQNLQRTLSAQNKGKLKAIGVIGSDVYDKLLVLKALRPHFPQILFFTTDLDARMLHPSEYGHTRNLIVASPYGLTLHDDLQRGAMPFRDSYQTAMYLTTLYAIGDREARDRLGSRFPPPSPRVFEIGRSGAYDLGVNDTGIDHPVHPTSERLRDARWWLTNWVRVLAAVAIATMIVFALLPRILETIGDPLLSEMQKAPDSIRGCAADCISRLRRIFSPFASYRSRLKSYTQAPWRARLLLLGIDLGVLLASLGLAATVLAAIVLLRGPVIDCMAFVLHTLASYFEYGAIEPLSLFDGISAWPVVAIQLIGVLLLGSLALLAIKRHLTSNQDALQRDYFPSDNAKSQREVNTASHWWRISFATDRDGAYVQVQTLWQEYERQGKSSHRFGRAAKYAFIFLLLLGLLGDLMGFPIQPIRGASCRMLDTFLFVAGSLVLSLILSYVVDAALLCHGFVAEVCNSSLESRRKDGRKSEQARPTKAQSEDIVDDMVRIVHVIAELTHAVYSCLIWPFVVLVMMALSRHRVIDNSYTPGWLIAVWAAAALLIVVCGWRLRYSAQRARAYAVQELAEQRFALLEKPREDTDDTLQLKSLTSAIEEISATRTGAFASVAGSSLLSAPLIPAGIYGLWELAWIMIQRTGHAGG